MPTLRLPYPHKGQQTVRLQAKRFNWLSAGRRWRKTTLGVAVALEGVARGETWLWGAPTYDQVRIAWAECKHGAAEVGHFLQNQMTMFLPMSGGKLIFRSLDDPDNARGHTADGIIVDEAGDVKEEAYYEVLRSILIDTRGEFWALGTPKGRNWFWREHRAALDRDDSMSWQVPTVGAAIEGGVLVRKPHPLENPEIPFEEIERIYETMAEDIFEQEILAAFLDMSGSVFKNIGSSLTARAGDRKEHEGHRKVAGVDWGKQHDFTVFSLGCSDCKVELALYRSNKLDYAFQEKRLAALAGGWKLDRLEIELNAMGQPIFEQLERRGLRVMGFNTTSASKPPLIENLALAIEKQEWGFLRDEAATAELEAYERKVNPITNRSTYGAPKGLHDDTVIARALMLRAATETGPAFVF